MRLQRKDPSFQRARYLTTCTRAGLLGCWVISVLIACKLLQGFSGFEGGCFFDFPRQKTPSAEQEGHGPDRWTCFRTNQPQKLPRTLPLIQSCLRSVQVTGPSDPSPYPPGNIAPHAQHASHEFWSENRMMIPKMFVNQNLQLLKKRNLSDLSHLLKTAGLVQNPPFYPEPSGPPKTEQRP